MLLDHGHSDARVGPRRDGPTPGKPLDRTRLSLGAETASGVAASDEVGFAVRGRAPVRRDGAA
jgi:hypothetical protein